MLCAVGEETVQYLHAFHNVGEKRGELNHVSEGLRDGVPYITCWLLLLMLAWCHYIMSTAECHLRSCQWVADLRCDSESPLKPEPVCLPGSQMNLRESGDLRSQGLFL